jgi:Base plate wedge protein 53
MGKFLDKFPFVIFTADRKISNEYDLATNILTRIGVIKDVMENNINAYFYYIIEDGDRPEILAEKVYNDPEAHWIILYANNIYDPLYDWPMDQRTFDKYIIKKYGSLQWAKTNYHHYEKVITRENPLAQVISTTRFEVNEKILTDGILTLDTYSMDNGLGPDYVIGEIAYVGPSNAANTFSGQVVSWSNSNGQIVLSNTRGGVAQYQYLNGQTSSANAAIFSIDSPDSKMDAYNTLVDTTNFSTYIVAGKTVFETISRNRVTYYDYEERLNEDKRLIKVIQPQYYQQIISELDNITGRKVAYRRP